MRLAGLLVLIAVTLGVFAAAIVTREYWLFGWGVIALALVMVASGAEYNE